MVTSTLVPPFALPPFPPRPLVVLLSATDLDDGTSSFAPLLTHQDLIDKQPSRLYHQLGASRYHPYRHASSRNATPCPSTSRAESSPLSSPNSSDNEDSESTSSSDSLPAHNKAACSVAFAPFALPGPVSDKIRIPRPKGAGRKPLLQLVKWGQVQLDAMKKSLRICINQHLNRSDCFMDQDKVQLDKVKKQMATEFPVLDDYEALWPLDIMLISQLKYTTAASKGTAVRRTVDAVLSTLTSAT